MPPVTYSSDLGPGKVTPILEMQRNAQNVQRLLKGINVALILHVHFFS